MAIRFPVVSRFLQDLPCWLALQEAGIKIDRCFTCDLYKPQPVAA